MRVFAIALLTVSAAAPGIGQNLAESLAPYIPTPQILVETMLDAAEIQPDDVVYDLGSGDGRIVITAAQKFGVRAVGVELKPELCRTARQRVEELGLGDKVKIVQGSALRTDLSEATVVTLYLLTTSNSRLRPNMEKYLKPGARVVSIDYPVKGWKEARLKMVKTGSTDHKIYVYKIGYSN